MSPDEASSDTDRRCKHMVRYPHECRDCEAEADAAHRASGEGGSTSAASAASAPEGIDAQTACRWAKEIQRFQEGERWMPESDCWECDGEHPVAGYLCAFHASQAFTAARFRAEAQAVKQANLARASHSLAPEGISADDVATIVEHLTGVKLADDRATWAAALLNERAKPIAAHVAVCGPVSEDEAKAIGSMIGAASKMMADQSGAAAPLPPEGITEWEQLAADCGMAIDTETREEFVHRVQQIIEQAAGASAHVAVCGPVSEDEAKAIGSMIGTASRMMADQSGAAAPSPPEGLAADIERGCRAWNRSMAATGAGVIEPIIFGTAGRAIVTIAGDGSVVVADDLTLAEARTALAEIARQLGLLRRAPTTEGAG